MQFSPELRDGVAAGKITLSFRLWTRPQVKVGGQYATAGVRIEIDSMEMVPFSSVIAGDIRHAGEPDRGTLRRRTAHAGPVDDDTLVYRIEFHVLPSAAADGGALPALSSGSPGLRSSIRPWVPPRGMCSFM